MFSSVATDFGPSTMSADETRVLKWLKCFPISVSNCKQVKRTVLPKWEK